MATAKTPEPPASEIVLGLVAPVGTDLDDFEASIETSLRDFDYSVNRVRLSNLARLLVGDVDAPSSELARINASMDDGNKARMRYGGEVLALAAAAHITGMRPTESGRRVPLERKAHVVRSLKHPGEALALRRVYGPGFFLIGVVAPKESRRAYLRDRKGIGEPAELEKVLARDYEEKHEYGQRTRDTFHLADVFLPLGDKAALRRFLDLVFAKPHLTPTPDEHAMFMAFTAALRSGDLSRQVGAVVANAGGDLIAIGANDVPKSGGGLYWPGPDDDRDHALGYDSNQRQRDEIVEELLCKLKPEKITMEAWRAEAKTKIVDAKVMDITEYGRAVHAEMEALLSCARSGVSAKGGSLFSTTFPCHNCAKHILAAGIRRVIYVEPYPKSYALKLFPKEIYSGPLNEAEGRVAFEAFQGIGPRRFLDLFSVDLSAGFKLKRKDKDGEARSWQPAQAETRVALLPTSYIDREEDAAVELMKKGGLA